MVEFRNLDELSAERVLTSERVYGRRFYDVLTEPQQTKDRYGEIINRFAHGSILSDGIFSGDPHPGNYIFMDDGRICFLDFGLVKRLDANGRAQVTQAIEIPQLPPQGAQPIQLRVPGTALVAWRYRPS